MSEDFLHYLWKYKKFDFSNLQTTREEEVILKNAGEHNINNAGPDFFNSRLIIDGQQWAGTVEIHKKSSDWYAHHHEKDPLYDNVILHVVWEDNVEIFRKDNSIIPTLELKKYVDTNLMDQYLQLFYKNTQQWIPCEKDISKVPEFIISNWQERLFFERLEQKSLLINQMLETSSNDWEAVLFKLLFKNFGLKVNGEAFLSVANSFDYAIVRKSVGNKLQMEALFFGQSGLLTNDITDPYFQYLKKEYDFLISKFKLSNFGVLPIQFFRLRPANFPTIRISQLAMLYTSKNKIFNQIIETKTIEGFYELFDIETSDFWKNHYTFEKKSVKRKKILSKSFIDLLVINTIIPLKFVYAKSIGKSIEDIIIELMGQLPAEQNSIINRFSKLGIAVHNSLHSQAMLQLKKAYCDKKACLDCAIGNYLLNTKA